MQARSLTQIVVQVTEVALRRPWRFFFAAVVLTAVSVWLALGLEIRSSFEELLPPNLPSVVHIKELLRRVGGEGTVLVTVENLNPGADLSGAEAFATRLAEEYRKLGPSVIRSVESNVAPIEGWYADHWPLFASLEDLRTADEDLRKAVSKAKAKANPLLLHLDDDDPALPPASKELGPWGDPNSPLPRTKVAEQFRGNPGGFFVHPDGRSVTIMVRPAGTSLSVKEARLVLDRMRRVADGLGGELRANNLRVGFGGTYAILVAEYEAIVQSIGSTALLVASLVLLSMLLFFRDLRSTLALGVAMLVAVAITFAITRLVIGHLNTQTAFLWAIVLGNGINYGLIYLARERQLRRTGMALGPAAIEGAKTAASATLLASAASSVSFAVLMLAANRGFRDFGFIGAVGMLLSWISTFTLLPALLTIFEKLRPLRPVVSARRENRGGSKWAAAFEKLSQRPGAVVAIFGALTLFSAVQFIRFLPDAMERNLENVTNELQATNETARFNDRGQKSIGMSIEGAIALLPSRQAADEFCRVIRHRQSEPRWKGLIDRCETISSVIPVDQEQKLAVISSIRQRLSDLLLDSVDPKQRDRLRQVREDLAAQRIVTAADAPTAIVDPFREQDGTLGRIATVTASRSAKLELAPNLDAFVQAIRNVPVEGKLYEAAGEDVVVADLLRDIETEGPRTSFLSLAGVCVLVFFFFRASRDSLFVLGTLLAGVVLMSGVAVLLHLKINFFNFIVFPITFGISRIREREGRVLASLMEVGPAVALCSWTSIIGYASLLPSVSRALRSFGLYAVAGEVASIVCALVLLPALKLMISPRVRAPRTHVAAEPF